MGVAVTEVIYTICESADCDWQPKRHVTREDAATHAVNTGHVVRCVGEVRYVPPIMPITSTNKGVEPTCKH